MMTKTERVLLTGVSFLLGYVGRDLYKTKNELKDAKSEIELIGNFCADSIPPRVMENGRAEEKDGHRSK